MPVTLKVTGIFRNQPEQKRNKSFLSHIIHSDIFNHENVKKMCPKNFSAPKNSGETPPLTRLSGVDAVRQYDQPIYKENGAGAYIEFRAYDPGIGNMRRKTIKLNKIKGSVNRRAYARELIKHLNEQLKRGWNPWIAQDASNLIPLEEAIVRYENHIEKMLANGYFRKETYDGYKSYVKIMREFIKKKRPTYYCYQLDRKFCVDFLDYVFIERNNGAQTRNNYLNFLRVFCGRKVVSSRSRPTASHPSANGSTRKSASAFHWI